MKLFELDYNASKWIHEQGQHTFAFWEFISIYGAYLYAAYFFGVVIASPNPFKSLAIAILSVVSAGIAVLLMRYLIRRRRPTFIRTEYKPWMDDYSFPSGHASMVFAVTVSLVHILATISNHLFILGSIALLVLSAILISLSRIMLGVHYLFDIIAGMLLGTGISMIVLILAV